MPSAPVSDDALKILLVLRDTAMEGYSLMSRTGLSTEALGKALDELLAQNLIIVKGDLGKERIGDAYISLRPSARSFADMILQFRK